MPKTTHWQMCTQHPQPHACTHSVTQSLTATLTGSPEGEGVQEPNTGVYRNWTTGAEPSTTIKIRLNMCSDLYDLKLANEMMADGCLMAMKCNKLVLMLAVYNQFFQSHAFDQPNLFLVLSVKRVINGANAYPF